MSTKFEDGMEIEMNVCCKDEDGIMKLVPSIVIPRYNSYKKGIKIINFYFF